MGGIGVRKAALLLATLFLCLSARAGEPYFCNVQGTELHYVRKNVTDGTLVWRHVMTIDSVASDGTVCYNSLFTKPGGARMYGGPVPLEVAINDRGDVEMNVARSVGAIFSNVFGTRAPRTAGGSSVLPADMKPGDVLPDVAGTASAKLVSMDVRVTGRRVLQRESLTTPAGTFDCIVVQEHKVEKGTFRNRVTTARTWYARGVGMVRHDTYDRNMVLETSEVLIGISNKSK